MTWFVLAALCLLAVVLIAYSVRIMWRLFMLLYVRRR